MSAYRDEDFLQLSGLQHFAFCRRQWALIHVEANGRKTCARWRAAFCTAARTMRRRASGGAIRSFSAASPSLPYPGGIGQMRRGGIPRRPAGRAPARPRRGRGSPIPWNTSAASPRNISPTNCSCARRPCAWRRCSAAMCHRARCFTASRGGARRWILRRSCAGPSVTPARRCASTPAAATRPRQKRGNTATPVP